MKLFVYILLTITFIFLMTGWNFLSKDIPLKAPALFCLYCYETGRSPWKYSLNRNNESTKKNHFTSQHKDKLNRNKLVSYKDKSAKEALLKWQNWKVETSNKSAKTQKRKDPEPSVSGMKKHKKAPVTTKNIAQPRLQESPIPSIEEPSTSSIEEPPTPSIEELLTLNIPGRYPSLQKSSTPTFQESPTPSIDEPPTSSIDEPPTPIIDEQPTSSIEDPHIRNIQGSSTIFANSSTPSLQKSSTLHSFQEPPAPSIEEPSTRSESPTPELGENVNLLSKLMAKLEVFEGNLQDICHHITTTKTKEISPEHANNKELNWEKVNNLQDLLIASSVFSCERRLKDVLYIKCNACNQLMSSIDGRLYQNRIKRHDTFPYGLKVKLSDENNLWTGTGREWVIWKCKLKKHMEGSDRSLSDIHLKGLCLMEQGYRTEARAFTIHKNFVICALDTVASKSAAVHFESKLSVYETLGVDIGDKQHSRNQFPDILDSICTALNQRIDDTLSSPLPSTGRPPHFFLTFNKSTPDRSTNQAVVLVAVVGGERVPYFLGAPEVYSVERGGSEVSGGQSESLAAQVFQEVKTNLPNVSLKACSGAVADGQYVNTKFKTAFFSHLEMEENEFTFLVWDASHFMDLAAKKFLSQPYLSRLGERAAKFHCKLGRGKMHTITQKMGSAAGGKTLVTKSLSTTRFISSTVESFQAIKKCFPQYIAAMYEYGRMRHNTDDTYCEDEYMVAADDFLIDLLVVIDVLSQLVSLMVVCQGVQSPCWKVIPHTQAVLEELGMMCEELDAVDEPDQAWNLDTERWPSTAPHVDGIVKNKAFKGVPLVDGWLVDKSVQTNSKNPVGWKQRLPDDCLKDAVEFVRDIRQELNRRLEASVPPAMEVLLNGVDLSRLMALVVGTWSQALGEPLLMADETEAQTAFTKFFHHIKDLSHVREDLKDEDPIKVLKQCIGALKWIIWSDSYEASLVRKQVFVCKTCEVSYRPSSFSYTGCNKNFESTFQFGNPLTKGTDDAVLDETRLTLAMYTNPEVYNRVGKSFCIGYDIALAKGGSEAVVESVYSVMNSQSQSGGQSNANLVMRTKVDWHCPPSPLGITDFIEDSAKIHHAKHATPISKLKFGKSKVMTRLMGNRGKIPVKKSTNNA